MERLVYLKDSDEYGDKERCIVQSNNGNMDEFEDLYYQIRCDWYEKKIDEYLFKYLKIQLAAKGYFLDYYEDIYENILELDF